MALFSRRKTGTVIVSDYPEACRELKKVGVDIRPRASPDLAGLSSIIIKDGLFWTFNGDANGFSIGRMVAAPADWDENTLWEWNARKNYVSASYVKDIDSFVLSLHIATTGGVLLKNLIRQVINFDILINAFLVDMKIPAINLPPLE